MYSNNWMTINNNQPSITQFYIFFPVKTNINKTQTCLICKVGIYDIFVYINLFHCFENMNKKHS